VNLNPKVIAAAGLVGLGLYFALTYSASAAEPEADVGDLPPAGLPEADACAVAVLQAPTEYMGKTADMVGAKTQALWLTWVAWWQANPGREAPASEADLNAFARLGVCVTEKLKPAPDDPPPKPLPKPNFPTKDDDALPVPSPEPTPGQYYQIREYDQLLGTPGTGGVASRAYGTSGKDNLAAAQHINNHPYNQRFQRTVSEEKNLFPPNGKRISFLPMFGTVAQQYSDAKDGSGGDGKNYAMIFIPK